MLPTPTRPLTYPSEMNRIGRLAMDPTQEVWLPVVHFVGYEVSDQGNIRSLDRTLPCGDKMRRHKGRVLKPGKAPKGGHRFVALTGGRSRYVHRLVMEAFVGPCPDGMEVRHGDGDPDNNHLTNLAYGTHADNARDMLRHGNNHNARKTHCVNGHAFVGDNIAPRKGGRRCRECKIAAGARRRVRLRAA